MGLQKFIWSLILRLPDWVKAPVLRKIVAFPTDIDNSLRFKVAETEDELSQAFSLLHDAYVKEKLMDPHPSGMRITKYHALPSTTTLIAIENKVVVGTVSLIRQSAFGLPLKAIFDLSNVAPGSRLAEVSALAIKKEHLHQRGRILFPLLKFLFHYSYDYFGVTHFVIAVNPKWIDFYKAILAFKPLSKKVVSNYSFVNGAPASGAILDLELASEVYYKIYSNKRKEKNLFSFFRELECKNMEFPLRKKSIITDPMLSANLLKHFFIESSDCMKSMSEIEHFVLREMYDHPDYLKLIPEPKIVAFRQRRDSKRFETTLNGRLQLPDDKSLQILIQDISCKGFGGVINPNSVEINRPQTILVNVEEVTPCELEGTFIRLTPSGEFGFKLSKPSERWNQFIRNLEDRVHVTTRNDSVPHLVMKKTGSDK